jgi:hypothetical protein
MFVLEKEGELQEGDVVCQSITEGWYYTVMKITEIGNNCGQMITVMDVKTGELKKVHMAKLMFWLYIQ